MSDFSTIKQNILYFIENQGISKYKFYQQTGISNGVLSQKGGMSEENISKILSFFPELNANWLLTGTGSMLKSESVVNGNINSQIAQNVNGGVSQVQGNGENSVSLLQQENTFLKEKIALLEQNIQLLKELKEK